MRIALALLLLAGSPLLDDVTPFQKRLATRAEEAMEWLNKFDKEPRSTPAVRMRFGFESSLAEFRTRGAGPYVRLKDGTESFRVEFERADKTAVLWFATKGSDFIARVDRLDAGWTVSFGTINGSTRIVLVNEEDRGRATFDMKDPLHPIFSERTD